MNSTPWLQCRPPAASPRMRLFCLPHAGGGSTSFRSWNAALPPWVQVCSVALPGREARHGEPLYTELDSLVDAILSEVQPLLDLPYAVFGHSMGSLLAFELVRRLRRQGYSKPVWLFLSGRSAPQVFVETKLLHALPDQEFLDELGRRYAGIPQEVLSYPEFLEVFLPILRADISIVESYRFREDDALDCPITVFAGIDDASVTWGQMHAWKLHTRGRFAFQLLPGGHFYPHEPLLQTISATLAELASAEVAAPASAPR